jgi:thioesterase domain-containing protein
VGRNLRELAQLGPREKLARILPGVKARLQARAITVRVSVGWRLPPSVRSRYIRDIYFRAYRSYVPRPYPSPTLVVGEQACPAEERYWRNLLTGDVEMHWLTAGHYDVIAPPYLQAWAEPLREGLRRTDTDAALEVLRSAGRRRAIGHP